jgi:3-hydroxybutyryl-CoA dehydrogenase
MGAGIAQVAAASGLSVALVDVASGPLEKGMDTIRTSLARLVKREKLSAEQAQVALSRISPSQDLAALAGCQLVVEAVPERFELKRDVLVQLDGLCGEHTILASNTSSISITRLAAATRRPDRVVGMHFMNPVPVMQLVELIRGLQTSDATFEAVRGAAVEMGKTTVESQDGPGFIVNRILMPMINEAVFALHEGLASAADIDTAMKLGTNQPMGPLALADFIGLDTCLAIMEVLHAGTGDTKYRACPLLRRYVDAGYLGKKSGRGFFQYDR